MKHRNDWNKSAVLILADFAAILLAFYLASLGRLYLPFGAHLARPLVTLPWPVYGMSVVVWFFVSSALRVHHPGQARSTFTELWLLLGSSLLSNLALAGLLYVSFRDVSRLLFFYALGFQVVFLICIRLFLRWRRRDEGPPRVLIIGAGRVGRALAQHMAKSPAAFILVGFLDDDPDKVGRVLEGAPVLGPTTQTQTLIDAAQVDEVIFALPLRAHQHLVSLILSLQALPVRVRVIPDLFDVAFVRATIEDFHGLPLIGLRDGAIDGTYRVVKRLFDLLIAGAALALALPIMGLVALAIRLDSPGPALFQQSRVGENGRVFTIWKFRSMRVDAGENGGGAEGNGAYQKRPDDPRITRVGRFIRRTSLDELPQLFNVIRGEMSLVGPRPELPALAEQYAAWQRRRFAVPPGMTGWWQVNGRSERPMHEHTEDDLYYIQHYSPWLDLYILWRTIAVVARGRGAY